MNAIIIAMNSGLNSKRIAIYDMSIKGKIDTEINAYS